MENATKALLIAAAILIAILVISLGVVVYQRSAESVEGMDLSGQSVQANNEKFTRYNGEHKKGSEVNAMLKTVLSSNTEAGANNEIAKQVIVVEGKKDASGNIVANDAKVILSTNATNIQKTMPTSSLYTIVVDQNGAGGLVNKIIVYTEPAIS